MATYESGTPNIVFIGLPNLPALERARAKIRSANILHYAFHEPDFNLGFTAICTAPIHGAQRDILKNYRLYQTPVAQVDEHPALNREDVGTSPTGRANAGGTSASEVRP